MRTVHKSITLFAALLLLLLLLLIVIYDCVGTYDETIIMDLYFGEWWCQSPCWICYHVRVRAHLFPQGYLLRYYSKHIHTFGWCCWLFYNIMMLCWYGWLGTRITVKQPFVMTMMMIMMLCRYQNCMPGGMNNSSSNGTHLNNNNTTVYSSFPLDGVGAGAYPWIQCVYRI